MRRLMTEVGDYLSKLQRRSEIDQLVLRLEGNTLIETLCSHLVKYLSGISYLSKQHYDSPIQFTQI